MSAEKKIMNAFGWQSINVICQSVLQLVFNAIIARLLLPESFGIMAIVLIVTSFIDIFAQVGIGPAIIQRKDITEKQISSSFYLSILLGLCFFTLLWFSAPAIAKHYNDIRLVDLLQIIGFSFIIASIGIVPKSLLYKKLKFKQLFISTMIGMFIGLIVVGLPMAFLGCEVWTIVAYLLVQNAIMTICYWYFNPVSLKGKPSIKYAMPLVKYGGGSTLFTLFNYLSSKIDTLIVSNYSAGNNGENSANNWNETGVYDQSIKVIGYPITIIGKLSDSVMFSGLSMIQDQKQKLKFAFRSAFSVLATISLPASIFLFIYSKEIVLILLGDQYYSAIPIVQFLFLGLFFRTIIKLCDSIVRALDRVYTGAFIKLVYFLCVTGFVYIMATNISKDLGIHLGLQGVALALLAAILIQFIIMIATCLSILNLSVSALFKLLIGPLFISIITAVICFGLQIFSSSIIQSDAFMAQILLLIIGAVGFGMAYFIVIWFAPTLFGKGEHNMLRVLLRKLPSKGIIQTIQKRVEEKTNPDITRID